MNTKESVEGVPYHAWLGLAVEALDENGAQFTLPYSDQNSNPGKVLHGGVGASMIAIAGMAVGRAALGEGAGPFHTCGFSVNYLSAAIGEAITTEAKLLRKGKELCYSDVIVKTASGKMIANGSSIVRGRFGAAAPPPVQARGDDTLTEPGPMGAFLPQRVPFIGNLGMKVENMSQGLARIAMPFLPTNADDQGNVHEGAILSLLDTTGAMAAWAHIGVGPYKASTIGVQAQIRAASGQEDLIAHAKMVQQDREIFWCDVEVAVSKTREVVAGGTVIYRIVTGKD